MPFGRDERFMGPPGRGPGPDSQNIQAKAQLQAMPSLGQNVQSAPMRDVLGGRGSATDGIIRPPGGGGGPGFTGPPLQQQVNPGFVGPPRQGPPPTGQYVGPAQTGGGGDGRFLGPPPQAPPPNQFIGPAQQGPPQMDQWIGPGQFGGGGDQWTGPPQMQQQPVDPRFGGGPQISPYQALAGNGSLQGFMQNLMGIFGGGGFPIQGQGQPSFEGGPQQQPFSNVSAPGLAISPMLQSLFGIGNGGGIG